MRTFTRLPIVIAGLALSLGSLACADLPVVNANVCGNGIVEDPEECDTYADPGQTCRAPGTVGACRFDCSPQNGGAEACPNNETLGHARCGADNICRFSTGSYSAWGDPLAIPAQSLRLGDFDGDGRQDLLALGNSNDLWQSFPRILFFDDTGQPQNVFDPHIPVSSPSILTLNQSSDAPPDPREQLVCGSSYGISALEVTHDRSVLPIPYPIQQLPQGWLYRMARVRGTSEISTGEGVLIFMGLSGNDTTEIGQIIVADSGFLLSSMPKPVDQIVGEPIAANVVDGTDGTDSPCEEALFAFGGDGNVYMLAPCDAQGHWQSAQTPQVVTLPDNHTISRTPIAARVDQDEHIDLLLADESGNPYVAFGRGDGTFVADPSNPDSTLGQAWPVWGNCLNATAVAAEFPLAVGDVNNDGKSDWVTPHGVHLVQSVTVDSLQQRVVVAACLTAGPFVGVWSSASIADFNRDGLLDVIAGSVSEPELTFLEGTGLDVLNSFGILSGGPLSGMVIGDFDGDLISDVAFSVQMNTPEADQRVADGGLSNATTEKLSIAFGNASGPPGTPVEIGQFATIQQMQTAKYSGNDAIDEIGVFAQSSDNSGPQLSIFIGGSGRHPIAPLGLAYAQDNSLIDGIPLATAVGKIGTDTNPGALSVAVNCQSTCEYRAWLVPGTANGKFGPPIPSPKLPPEFAPDPTNPDSVKVAYHILIGDVDQDEQHAAEGLVLAEGLDGSTINLWSMNLPPAGGIWNDQQAAMQLSSTGPGKLSVTSNPTLVDLDGDGALDLVLITQQLAADGHWKETLGVVWNREKSLDISRLSRVDLNGQEARGFSVVSDRGATRLVAITDDAVYAIRHFGRLLSASPIDGEANDAGALANRVPGGSSIALGDLTGDGLLDLAIGISVPSQVLLFREMPKRP